MMPMQNAFAQRMGIPGQGGQPSTEQREQAKSKLAAHMEALGVERYSVHFIHAWDHIQGKPLYRMDARYE